MGSRDLPKRCMTFIYLMWTLSTLSLIGYGFMHFAWQGMMVCFAFNALEGAGTIVWLTTKQRLVPGRLLGRVSSFDWFISIGLLPVSYALTAPVAGWLGARETLVWAGLVGGVITFAFLFLPGLRDPERQAAARGPQPVRAAPVGAIATEGAAMPISAVALMDGQEPLDTATGPLAGPRSFPRD
jgi:hypothetical protein